MSDSPNTPPLLSATEQRQRTLMPYIIGCALFMQMLDSTVVATAMPAMAEDLDTSVLRMNAVITSYLLALAVFVPISGWAADRFGARRIFMLAISLFTLSSIACALAQSLQQLIAARVVQGVGGAMMVPVGRIILLKRIPKAELLQAMAVLTLPALFGPILGPPVGGFLVTYVSWHWIFLINVPVGIVGLVLILKYIRPDLPSTAQGLDWLGFLLSGVALSTLVMAFESLGHSNLSLRTLIALLIIGVLSSYGYVRHARRKNGPIIDLSLLKVRSFAISVVGGNLCRFSIGSVPFMLAILLQVGFGFSALNAGLVTFTSAIGALLMKPLAPPIIRLFGYRRVLMYNAFLTGGTIMLCAFFTSHTPVWLMCTVLAVGGVFRSLQFTAVNTLSYADVDLQSMAQASTFASMAQQLGISIGVACAAVAVSLSLKWRGGNAVEVGDLFWGFILIGALTALSSLSFSRLAPDAGSALQHPATKQT